MYRLRARADGQCVRCGSVVDALAGRLTTDSLVLRGCDTEGAMPVAGTEVEFRERLLAYAVARTSQGDRSQQQPTLVVVLQKVARRFVEHCFWRAVMLPIGPCCFAPPQF